MDTVEGAKAGASQLSHEAKRVPRWLRRGREHFHQAQSAIATIVASGVPQPIAEILVQRGVNTAEACADWFKPTLKKLREPLSLRDADRAVERLIEARRKQESIVLYADYDLDGTSGLALALEAFAELGFERVSYYQPKRLSEGYGLHVQAIEKLKNETSCSLLVSIDLGITAMVEVDFARTLGIDVIVTDHHLPKLTEAGIPILPEAYAVVNPNRGDCPSELGHLCGTGVIFYIVLALRRALLEQGTIDHGFDPKSLLDCYAIGTITDLVPLHSENRVLVKHGLHKLAETKRPGLRELLRVLGLLGRPLNAQDVAIRFAPKLNALSRMEMGLQPIDLYLEKDESRARELVERVLANNQDRQASQKIADDEANRLLAQNPPKHAIFICSPKFHRGIVGLVATKLCSSFGLPAFVGAMELDAKGEVASIVGSARVPNGAQVNLLSAMAAANDCFDQFGGHAVAAGFDAKVDRVEEIRTRLEEWFAASASGKGAPDTPAEGATEGATEATNLGPFIEFDAECHLRDLTPALMSWLEHLGPFGAHAPIPIFRFDDCLVAQVRELKGGHIRLRLAQPGAEPIQGIWFSPPAHEIPRLGDRCSVLAEVQWNHFQGTKSIQLMVQSALSHS